MSDDIIEVADIDLPGDEWICGLIRTLRGLPPRTPIHPEILARWRGHLRSAMAARRARDRRQEPTPAPPLRKGASVSPDDVIQDLLASPEGLMWIAVALALPRVIAVAVAAARADVPSWARWQQLLRRETGPVLKYLDVKVGRGGALPTGDDLPAPVHRAAINAVSPAAARAWRDRLSIGAGDARAVLVEMREIGKAATDAARPLRLWDPEPGQPRGIWPDPPQPEDPPAVSSDILAGGRPPFVPGDRK